MIWCDGVATRRTTISESEWNLPPTDPRSGPIHDKLSEHGARQADRNAAQAYARGDGIFAALREADAGDLRQKRWDWGDARTWIWIVGMCAAFLLLCLFVYFLPYGRHNQNDGPAPSPTIRVY